MNSTLIYRDGKGKVNSLTRKFAGYKNFIYNNIMDVAFEPEGTGKVIFKSEDFVMFKMYDPAPKEALDNAKNFTLKIKFDEEVSFNVCKELIEVESFDKVRDMNGLFLVLKKCIDYEINLEKQTLTIFKENFSYSINYNFVNTFIETPGGETEIIDEEVGDIEDYHKKVEENRDKRANKRFRV